MNDLAGLIVVVTGGASGIGAAVAAVLTERGAAVAVLDVSVETDDHYLFHCDVADDASVAAAIGRVVNRHGGIDGIVHSAGVAASGTVELNGDHEWARVLDVNVTGVARVARHCLPHLRKSGSASIVTIGSVAADVGFRDRALYAASKGAVRALTLSMAADHLSEGIRVNCVLPATTDTPWVTRLLEQAADPEATHRELINRQPLGRLIEADEVAHAVAYLTSPQAKSVTGVCLAVDGGLSTLRSAG